MTAIAVTSIDRPSHTRKMIEMIKENNQDHEWYPTTDEIANIIADDLNKTFEVSYESRDGIEPKQYRRTMSIMDIGSGDGRVLDKLTYGKKYAIEKSPILQKALSKDIFIIGTDLHDQTLLDKKCDVIFCNPPYLEYEKFVRKIITEANAGYVYFVIPHRWEMSTTIAQAISDRKATVTNLGLLDFKTADRSARAIVDIIKVSLCRENYRHRYASREIQLNVNPFKMWFDKEFQFEANENEVYASSKKTMAANELKETVKSRTDIITQQGLVKSLEQFYQKDMINIMNTYKKLNDIDSALLKELGVVMRDVNEGLRLKIEGKKEAYWKELFSNLNEITDKLTSNSRDTLLNLMQSNMSIDFTASNAYAVCIWVLKNCNQYYDDQVIDLVEKLYNPDAVINYVSNKKTLSDDHWKYNQAKYHDHYQLDYRIVATGMGGLTDGGYNYRNHECGLQERSVNSLNDILTVANNLGFIQNSSCPKAQTFTWERSKKYEFNFYDLDTGKLEVLFTCRAYQNGNFWLKFNQKFMQKLNVEFGRLMGWLRSSQQAADELNYPLEDVKAMFNCNIQLTAKNLPLLLEVAE